MLNVICVKHGTKYNEVHVNKLFNMVKRHLTLPFNFVCFTDNLTKINSNIDVRLLPLDIKLEGWWWKPYIFNKDHFPIEDTNLFFDLDMVIIKNIDKLVTYKPYNFMGLQDVGRVFGRPDKLGSAVMRWYGYHLNNLWENLKSNPNLTKQYPGGDQDYIWKFHSKRVNFYPKEWILSYKWEVRTQKDLIRLDNKWIFKNIAEPKIPEDTCVLAFHGTPNLEDTEDKIIVENWQ
ncbi:MAG: hypothetical protein EBT86_11270 [Actinobacteria bacterium]|nr:hypothetical protein [Actinomycetota bacterium]